jgi:DNA-binding transcriptional regulator LsrR (DeoR family)
MAKIEELRLMTRIAHLYYHQQLTQPEIARQLHLSQASVSRLLKRAQEEEIVRITVSMPPGVHTYLEERIQQEYKLENVIVADCLQENDDEILRAIGAAAAYYLETTVQPGEVAGISSWSETLQAMVDAMHPQSRASDARVVQILGGMGSPAAESHAANLTRRMARNLKGEAVFLPAPGVVPSREARQLYLSDIYVQEAAHLFESVSLALVGIGTVEPSRVLMRSGNVFSEQELETLSQAGAIGDICLRFFDRQGQPVSSLLDERVIGIRLEQLRKASRSVGIAGGRRKVEAIRAALLGRWINVLITDRFTAEML